VSLIRGKHRPACTPRNCPGGTTTLPRVTSLDPTPLPAPDAVPVFGRAADRKEPIKTGTFGLAVTYRKAGRKVEEEVHFDCYLNLDAGAVLRLMQAGTDEQKVAQATAMVLASSLVDDDGVPVDWTYPAEDEYATEEDPDELDEDAELTPLRGEPTEDEPDGALLYERWDGELVPWDDLAFDELTDGSSRRRFAYVMASTRHRVDMDALAGVQQWLVKQATNRPTKRPAPSGRGPRSTRRGSAGR
jgi:hypothetical protein